MTQDDGTTEPAAEGTYSAVADQQLDELEAGPDPDLYNAVLDVCELVLDHTSAARARSTAITTAQGIRFRIAVHGHHPYKVFWSSTDDEPRIEAIFPHP